ncbi:hypothetical protein ONZ43_g5480 [Nemania bipapillata]|uniref:Uncharacterized protein n=1 Tax=Nemania bipapillata TaxID=110536 RepID=A0ACC2IA74_9PEZI|nr:hypothetical protein ONZ43_g5480 [Nemania bipapillata]
MTSRVLLVSIAAFSCISRCSPTPAVSSPAVCSPGIPSLSWKIADFEWRTGYTVWSYYVGVGPAPPPPPTQFYNCGEAMVRINITGISTGVDGVARTTAREQVVPCVEQTSDAKLANITDMKDYNAGPYGPPPLSPHWFTCDMDAQLFIYPDGTTDPWADVGDRSGNSNLITRIRMDPVEMTMEIAQSWACDDDGGDGGGAGARVEVAGIAPLPPLACRSRSNLEPDMNFLINSPVMHGPGLNAPVSNGSVCTAPEFLIKAHISKQLERL